MLEMGFRTYFTASSIRRHNTKPTKTSAVPNVIRLLKSTPLVMQAIRGLILIKLRRLLRIHTSHTDQSEAIREGHWCSFEGSYVRLAGLDLEKIALLGLCSELHN